MGNKPVNGVVLMIKSNIGLKMSVKIIFVILAVVFFNTTLVQAQSLENMFPYEVSVYDYDTGELIGAIWFTAEHPAVENENLLSEIAMDQLELEIGGHKQYIGFGTTSKLLRIDVDRDDAKIYLQISGDSGTSGKTALFVSSGLASSRENVAVYLDNQPLNFEFKQIQDPFFNYVILVEYTHSTHMLIFGFSLETLETSKPWYAQPLSLALIGVAIVIALGAVYWFRFRR